MKENTPSFAEKYKAHKKWAREFAEENGIELDEGGERFIITHETENGKEHRTYIQAWEKLPLGDESGKFIEDIPIKEAIEAIKKYPGVPFPEAVKKFRNPSKR